MMRPQLFFCFTLLAIFISFVPVHSEEKKFAPSYCLRFKLNCQNEQKKKHVCCLYPLPEGSQTGGEIEPAEGEEGNNGSIKIRPIRLPQREKSGSSDSTTDPERINEPAKRPSSNFKPPTPSGISNRLNINKEKSTPSPASTAAQSPKRPRICIRLVVNCNSSPEHRCCKYDDEGEDQEEETSKHESKPSKDNKSEEDVPAKEKQTEAVEIEPLDDTKSTEKVDDPAEHEPPATTTKEPEKLTPDLPEESNPDVLEKSSETEKPPTSESDLEHVEDASESNAKVDTEDKSVELEDPVGDKSLEKVEEASIIIDEEPQVSESPHQDDEVESEDGAKLTFESVLNDQVQIVKDGEPYERIPAECFTQTFDCEANPSNRCCDFQ